MAEIHGPTGLCSPVTLSNEQAPSPIRACSHPYPPGSDRLGAAHGRRTADCRSGSQPAWSASHNHDPRPAQVVHADRKRE
jgi:hypothetical protein